MSCPRQDLIHVFHIPQASKTHSSKGMKSWRGSVLVGVVSHQLSAPTAQLMCVTALGWFGLGRREGGTNKEKSHMQEYIFLKNSFLCLLPSKQSKSDRKTTLWDRNKKKNNTSTQDHSFLEQNKLQENAVFNVNVQLPILLSPVWANPGLITELSPAPHTRGGPGGAGEGSCQ